MEKTLIGAVALCAGAPLLALGLGSATAWADTSATPVSHRDLAISFGGISLVKTGKSTAQSEGLNLAIASNNSQASASGIGIGNVAIATNNSYAASGGLLLNTAIADDNSTAFAALGLETGNTAVARNGSTANSAGSSFSTVKATNNSSARSFGSFNNVTADDGSTAEVAEGNANTVAARCGGKVFLMAQSNKVVTSAPCETG